MAKSLERAKLKQALQGLFVLDSLERWMDQPNRAFKGRRPRNMMRTSSGREAIWHMVKQIENDRQNLAVGPQDLHGASTDARAYG